jgi:hypothetical protein
MSMRDPSDVSQLAAAIDAGKINPAHIVAFIGKTEGNGLVNDFTRGYATLAMKLALAKACAIAPADVGKRVALAMSGGTEGGLKPHMTVFSVEPQALRAWSAYGVGIHHTVVVDNQAADVQAAIDWMARVPSACVASWRLLVTGPEPADPGELDALVQAAAALLGQPVQLLGPVAAQWKGGSLNQALPGLERLRRVLVDRLVLS